MTWTSWLFQKIIDIGVSRPLSVIHLASDEMDALHSNPRRCGIKSNLHPMPLSSPESPIMLQKGATFNCPKPILDEDVDPILDITTLLQRSSTCLKDDCIVASERHMARVLGSLDRTISGIEDSEDCQSICDLDESPVPKGLLPGSNAEPSSIHGSCMSVRDQKSAVQSGAENHHHASDSGIGTSISGSTESCTESEDPRQGLSAPAVNVRLFKHSPHQPLCSRSPTSATAITRSIASSDTLCPHQHVLSEYAVKEIRKHILIPILREPTLKNYHPLIQSIPLQITRKQITCLRDLEKTLIFLSPRYSSSKVSYLRFSEFWIQCVHTTVEYLNDRDLHRPTDRPYANGYFLDLVEQIRNYAVMMAAAREKRAAGQKLEEKDYHPGEKLVLEGGLSVTGRPATLVRVRDDGKTLYLDEPSEKHAAPAVMKRSFSQADMDESVIQSMARRKKGVLPSDIKQKCKECSKVFDRPCDLTKHEKTHSRPWKCPELSCKYHLRGWPTAKERDRHVNDKHSTCPILFKCQFQNCTYSSKRESNCKQHMEKAHGYIYIRSKSNGKRRVKGQAQQDPLTPGASTQTSEVTTPFSVNVSSPGDAFAEETSKASLQYTNNYGNLEISSNSSTPFDAANLLDDPMLGFEDPTFGIKINYEGFENFFNMGNRNEYNTLPNFDQRSLSTDTGSLSTPPPSGLSAETISLASASNANYTDNSSWTNPTSPELTFNNQVMTPALSADYRTYSPCFTSPFPQQLDSTLLAANPQCQNNSAIFPTLSNAGASNAMFFDPLDMANENIAMPDETFQEFPVADTQGTEIDFALFDASASPLNGGNEGIDTLFPPLQQPPNNEFYSSEFDDIMGDY